MIVVYTFKISNIYSEIECSHSIRKNLTVLMVLLLKRYTRYLTEMNIGQDRLKKMVLFCSVKELERVKAVCFASVNSKFSTPKKHSGLRLLNGEKESRTNS